MCDLVPFAGVKGFVDRVGKGDQGWLFCCEVSALEEDGLQYKLYINEI